MIVDGPDLAVLYGDACPKCDTVPSNSGLCLRCGYCEGCGHAPGCKCERRAEP